KSDSLTRATGFDATAFAGRGDPIVGQAAPLPGTRSLTDQEAVLPDSDRPIESGGGGTPPHARPQAERPDALVEPNAMPAGMTSTILVVPPSAEGRREAFSKTKAIDSCLADDAWLASLTPRSRPSLLDLTAGCAAMLGAIGVTAARPGSKP